MDARQQKVMRNMQTLLEDIDAAGCRLVVTIRGRFAHLRLATDREAETVAHLDVVDAGFPFSSQALWRA